MNRLKLATVWLDGCSGCHMSLLDIDAALIDVVGKADLVYGPLVDAQEFPEGVDVTLVEGAVSSQEDLKKLQKIRSRTRTLVALGDCAVTSNVSAMRNGLPVQKMLQSIYVEGVSGSQGGAGRWRAGAAAAGAARARIRQSGSARAWMPARVQGHPRRSRRPAGRAKARRQFQVEVRVGDSRHETYHHRSGNPH